MAQRVAVGAKLVLQRGPEGARLNVRRPRCCVNFEDTIQPRQID